MSEAEQLRRWLETGTIAVRHARERLDSINVFPVADSDTGTNIYLTLQEGNRAVSKLAKDASHRQVVAAFARGALVGARGNSGVIVSAYLGEFLRSIDTRGGLGSVDAEGIAASLDAASEAAYASVGSPVEGTILTVGREAATAALEAAHAGVAREGTIVAAVVAARAALARTHVELAPAHAAGVVDAGAAGLVLQLEMLAETVGGAGVLDAIDEVEWEIGPRTEPIPHHQAGSGYEVMFVAASKADLRASIRTRLEAIGDSVTVHGGHGLWQAHVHTPSPGDAVKVAATVRARHVVVRGIDDHAADDTTSVVALTTCPGLADALAEAGAIVVVVPNPTEVARKHVRRALRDASGASAVVVAGEGTLLGAAREVEAKRGRPHLTVLDASHEAHVVAAVAAASLATPGEDLVGAMEAAITATAVTETTSDALDEDVDSLVGPGTDLVTLILGRGVDPSVAETVRLSVGASAPGAEIAVYEGDQAWPPILVGVEGVGA